jgi:DNA-binding IclR family transcriptional regulator
VSLSRSPHTAYQLVGMPIADVLAAAADLCLADRLRGGQRTAAELGAETGTPLQRIDAILRGLANLGMIERVGADGYGPLSARRLVLADADG